jgi:hypothetical protein
MSLTVLPAAGHATDALPPPDQATDVPPPDQVTELVAQARERGAVAMTDIAAAF